MQKRLHLELNLSFIMSIFPINNITFNNDLSPKGRQANDNNL